MPIYEFACSKDGVFEELGSISDPPFAKCPKCGEECKRIMSRNSFRLLGNGWADEGYRSLEPHEKEKSTLKIQK